MTRSPLIRHPLYTITPRAERHYHITMLMLGALTLMALVLLTYSPHQPALSQVLPVIMIAVGVLAQGMASDPATRTLWVHATGRPSGQEAIRALYKAMTSDQHQAGYAAVVVALIGMVTSGDSLWMVITPIAWGWWTYACYVHKTHIRTQAQV